MSCEKILKVNEASGFALMFRVLVDGDYVTQADVDTFEYAIINDNTKEVLTALTELVVVDCVYDTLQTGPEWTRDNVGYNVKHQVDHTYFTDPDTTYRIEHKLTAVGGAEYYLSPLVIKLSPMYSN